MPLLDQAKALLSAIQLADVHLEEMLPGEKTKLGTDDGIVLGGIYISQAEGTRKSTSIVGVSANVPVWLVEIPVPSQAKPGAYDLQQIGVFAQPYGAFASALSLVVTERVARFASSLSSLPGPPETEDSPEPTPGPRLIL